MEQRVVHFEVTANDPNRAVKFYEKTFGWKFKKYDGGKDAGAKEYWLITTGNKGLGINGGMFRKMSGFSGFINTINVQSAEKHIKLIEKNGGKKITPIITIPGVGYTCYFEDTEGNRFGIIEENKNAKL